MKNEEPVRRGHTSESYEEPLFREHLLQAILWASGRADGDIGLD